jgi:hypothetical protein
MTADEYENMRRRWRQHAARNKLRYLAAFFEETSNPVFAWEAVERCLANDLTLPRWVRNYLLHVAGEMAHLSQDRVPRAGGLDRAVARAVGFKGGPRFNPFRRMADLEHEVGVAQDVYRYFNANQYYMGQGMNWAAVFADVAAAHPANCDQCRIRISAGTVKRYWYKHALTVIPRRLVDRAKSHKLDDILR